MGKTIQEIILDYIEQILLANGDYEVQHQDLVKESILIINDKNVLQIEDKDNELKALVQDIADNYKAQCLKTLSILSMKANQPDFGFGVDTLTGKVTVMDNGHIVEFKSIYTFNWILPSIFNI